MNYRTASTPSDSAPELELAQNDGVQHNGPQNESESFETARSVAHRIVTNNLAAVGLAERTLHVISRLPVEVVHELFTDPCFHIDFDNFEPGRGSTVYMAAPFAANWSRSRSVVLRRRLCDCREDFAYYVIAHEFAHAILWNGPWGDITDPEQAADALAAAWGFPRCRRE